MINAIEIVGHHGINLALVYVKCTQHTNTVMSVILLLYYRNCDLWHVKTRRLSIFTIVQNWMAAVYQKLRTVQIDDTKGRV